MKLALVTLSVFCALIRCSACAETASISEDFSRLSSFFANELSWLSASFEEDCYGDTFSQKPFISEGIQADISSILSDARSWQAKLTAISKKYQGAKIAAIDAADMRQVAEASAQMTPLRYRMQMVRRQIRITKELKHSDQQLEPTSNLAPEAAPQSSK